MKNIRTPRSLSESEFTTGYADKPFHPSRSVHPSTWLVIILGLIGLGLVIYTR
jgi:hypothetical protein